MTDTDQQKLDAIRDGVGRAFADLTGRQRSIGTMDAVQAGVYFAFTEWLDRQGGIEDGVESVFAQWLDAHTEEIVEGDRTEHGDTRMTTDPYERRDYLYAALDEIAANGPDQPAIEHSKALNELLAQSADERRFFTEVRRRHPEVTFYWDTEQQTVCLRGINLRTPGPR